MNISMKKIITSLSLLACLTGGIASAATNEAMLLEGRGVLKGTESGFELERSVNRAEFVTMLVRAAVSGSLEEYDTSCLEDVDGEWFAQNVCWAYDQYYINGYEDGNFHGGNTVNYAEALKILAEFFHYDLTRYSQLPSENWYDYYYMAAISHGIVNKGELDTQEAMAAELTRADAVRYIARAMAAAEAGEDRFEESQLSRLTGEKNEVTRALLEEEKLFLSLLRAQGRYGWQSVETESLGELALEVIDPSFGTVGLMLEVDSEGKLLGSMDTFEAVEEQVETTMTLSVQDDMSDISMDLKLYVRIRMVLDMEGFSFVFEDIRLEDIEGDVMVRMAVTDMVEEAEVFLEGVWVTVPFEMDEKEILEEEMDIWEVMVEVLEQHLRHTEDPFVLIGMIREGDEAHFTVHLDSDQLMEFLPKAAEISGQPVNTYAMKQGVREDAELWKRLIEAFSMQVDSTTKEWLIQKLAVRMEQETFEEDGVIVTMGGSYEESSDYYTEPKITTPVDPVTFEELFGIPAEYVLEELGKTENLEERVSTLFTKHSKQAMLRSRLEAFVTSIVSRI